MPKKLFTLLFIISTTFSFSQITFEKGYFIDNGDKKTECLIKNIDWKNNPTEFEYKLPNEEESKTKTIRYVKEFGVYDESRYERFTVPVERSNKTLNQLSYSREPVFKKETLYLKTLIEGEASLYLLQFGSQKKFFFKTTSKPIEQLIYKEYLIENLSSKKIGINNDFKKQLGKALECSEITMDNVLALKYTSKDLISFFEKYNGCKNQKYINYEKNHTGGFWNVTARAGLNSSSLSINNSVSDTRNVDFNTELSFRFGVEAEYTLPFNKNKWSLFIEPTYQSFKSEKQLTTSSGSVFVNQKVAVDYSSLELPLGVRYYFYIGDNSKIFINTGVIFDFNLNSDSKIDFERSSDLELSSSPLNLLYGIGYKFNNKFSLEVRNQTNRELLGKFAFWNSDYKTFSVIFGYTLF